MWNRRVFPPARLVERSWGFFGFFFAALNDPLFCDKKRSVALEVFPLFSFCSQFPSSLHRVKRQIPRSHPTWFQAAFFQKGQRSLHPWTCLRPASHVLHTNIALNCCYPAPSGSFLLNTHFSLLFFFFCPSHLIVSIDGSWLTEDRGEHPLHPQWQWLHKPL